MKMHDDQPDVPAETVRALADLRTLERIEAAGDGAGRGFAREETGWARRQG